MSLIGYASVSTEDQVTDAQTDVLKAAGCAVIFREHMSGAKASRPELAKALARVQRGDVLVFCVEVRLGEDKRFAASVPGTAERLEDGLPRGGESVRVSHQQGWLAAKVLPEDLGRTAQHA